MPMTETQQAHLSQRQTAKFAQDKKVPMLININDGRLIANSLNTRANSDYRPYTGSLKASREERMAFIRSAIGGARTRLINSAPDEEPTFDLGKATKAEIIAFAMDEYALVLDDKTDIRTLRNQVLAASQKASAIGAPGGEELG